MQLPELRARPGASPTETSPVPPVLSVAAAARRAAGALPVMAAQARAVVETSAAPIRFVADRKRAGFAHRTALGRFADSPARTRARVGRAAAVGRPARAEQAARQDSSGRAIRSPALARRRACAAQPVDPPNTARAPPPAPRTRTAAIPLVLPATSTERRAKGSVAALRSCAAGAATDFRGATRSASWGGLSGLPRAVGARYDSSTGLGSGIRSPSLSA